MMTGIFKMDYSKRLPQGSRVQIEIIKEDRKSQTGYMAKVVNEWKRPRWFDIGWFEIIK